MNINLIANYASKNRFYSEQIEGGYIIPKVIKVGKNRINISSNREQALLNNNSSFSDNFENDISYRANSEPILSYIKEFPIIIENKQLWNNILNSLGETSSSKYRRVNYFLLDFYFPYLGTSVEIDSEYHDLKQNYDRARDAYVKYNYGIETFRFYEYGKDGGHRLPYLKRFDNHIKYILKFNKINDLINDKTQIDFSKTIVNNFIEDNRGALEFIDKIINYIGEFNYFYCYNYIRLKKEDLKKIDNNFNINNLNNKLSLETLFLDNVINLMMEVYRVRLLIS